MAHANFKIFIKDVQEVARVTKIPVAVTLAQLILESSGKYSNNLSGLASKYKNLFGVKGVGPGGTVNLSTGEVYSGKHVTIVAGFRVYHTHKQSIEDHNRILNLTRYRTHTDKAKTIEEYCHGVKKGGYATGPTYAENLIKLIKQYNLLQYEVVERFTVSSVKIPTPTPTTDKPSVYSGNSIVDFLRSKNQKFDFASRRQLATKHGIKNYTGTAKQNLTLLKILRGF